MRCNISSMGFAEFNKHFLYAAVGAPGSTHDVRFLCRTSLFKDILNGYAILDKHIDLAYFGIVPLITVGDDAIPKYAWLLKACDDKTKDSQQRSP